MSDDAPQASAKKDPAADHEQGSISARSVTINKPVAEVFARFRDFPSLSGVMENVIRIDALDDRRTHWVVKAPGGRTVEWDARVTEEQPERLIAWESEEGADVLDKPGGSADA